MRMAAHRWIAGALAVMMASACQGNSAIPNQTAPQTKVSGATTAAPGPTATRIALPETAIPARPTTIALAPNPVPAATLRPGVSAGTQLPNSDEVRAAVAQGLDVMELPKQALDLALSEDDMVPGCRSRNDGFRDCGDPNGDHLVFLFGDSKAGMWGPALDDLGKEKHWRVVVQTLTGCPVPDFPLWSDSLKRRFTECDEFRASVFDNIKSLRPDLVLMSSNYSGNMRRERNGQPGEALGEAQGGAGLIWSDGLATILNRMKDYAGRVVVIGNIPLRGEDPNDCLLAHASDIRWCNTSRSVAVSVDLQNQTKLEASVAQRYGAEYVDTVPWFCTGSYCPDTVANLIVLRDVGHVTVQYSRWLREVIAVAVGLLPKSAAPTGG